MRPTFTLLRCVTRVIALLMVGASIVLAQAPAATPAPEDSALSQALVDTIGARIAALEVRRPDLLAMGRDAKHPDVVTVDRQLGTLRQQLMRLASSRGALPLVESQVLRAIDARLAGVIVQRRLLEAERPGTHPDLRTLASLEAMLRQRRAELSAATVGWLVDAP